MDNTASASNPLLAPIQQIMQFDPNNASPDVGKLFNDAYNTLAPYYTKLLQEANGDYNLATQYLQRDYQTGVRYANEDVERITQQTTDNLSSALSQLGITVAGEKENLLDTLNKRGIALTQAQPGVGGSPLDIAGGGRAAHEVGQEDQSVALRREALNRNAQQTIQNTKIQAARDTEQSGFKLQEGQTSAQQQLRNTGENLMTQRTQQAESIAGAQVGQVQAAQAMKQQQSALAGLGGGGATNTSGMTDAQKHINPSSGVWDDNYFSKTYG